MTDLDALLAAVLREPDDDVVRLAYADEVQALGDPDRAEFIRLQIRIAALQRDCWCGACVKLRGGGQHHNGPCAVDRERDESPGPHPLVPSGLWWRERKLIADHGYGWCDGLLGPGLKTSGGSKGQDTIYVRYYCDRLTVDVTVTFRRGFIDDLTLTAADWLAHADELYWRPGLTDPCPQFGYEPGELHVGCPVCRCTGRVPRPCPETAQPITRVTLAGDPPAIQISDSSLVTGYDELCWRLSDRDQWKPLPPGSRVDMGELLAALWPGITFTLSNPYEGRLTITRGTLAAVATSGLGEWEINRVPGR